MSKIKQALSEEALDAMDDVSEGVMSQDDWDRQYQPGYVDPVEKLGDMVDDDHDCHAEGGESGCDHPSHVERAEDE